MKTLETLLVNSLEGQKGPSSKIRQNLTFLRKEHVITHISLQMNQYIVLWGKTAIWEISAIYIDSFDFTEHIGDNSFPL